MGKEGSPWLRVPNRNPFKTRSNLFLRMKKIRISGLAITNSLKALQEINYIK